MAKSINTTTNTMASFVEKAEKGQLFMDWKAKNGDAFLSSVFAMASDTAKLSKENWQESEWLLSYYDSKYDSFTTFSSSGTPHGAKEQAFKKEKILPKLDAASIKIEIWEGIEAADNIRTGKYKEDVSSIIAILQPLNSEEIFGTGFEGKARIITVWNITYITKAYKVLNVKIDAETGKVLADSLTGVMDFMQDGNAVGG